MHPGGSFTAFSSFSRHLKDFNIPIPPFSSSLPPFLKHLQLIFSKDFLTTSQLRAFAVFHILMAKRCVFFVKPPSQSEISRLIASRDMVAQQLPPCHGPRCWMGWMGWRVRGEDYLRVFPRSATKIQEMRPC